MHKISDNALLKIVDTIDRLEKAVNVLEALPAGKRVYQGLKADAQKLSDELKDQFGLREYSDPNARDKWLEKEKKESGQ